jgi:hypothetical protein
MWQGTLRRGTQLTGPAGGPNLPEVDAALDQIALDQIAVAVVATVGEHLEPSIAAAGSVGGELIAVAGASLASTWSRSRSHVDRRGGPRAVERGGGDRRPAGLPPRSRHRR